MPEHGRIIPVLKKEYEKFRVVQDRYYESDFDKEVKKLLKR
jgi:hypothetical protein